MSFDGMLMDYMSSEKGCMYISREVGRLWVTVPVVGLLFLKLGL